jgi:3-deoxy-D-manno-octulosonic-acid transferase
VTGNIKYAGLIQKAAPGVPGHVRQRLNLGNEPLLVAGSVRGGEELPVLRAFAQVLAEVPNAVLLAAPRHAGRAANWLRAAASMGLSCGYWSKIGARPPQMRVVILDVMGLLFACYGLAQAVFVGASLINKGGQNPLEPAAWGVATAFGPYMDDFRDAAACLLPEAALQVQTHQDLSDFWLKCLQCDGFARRLGEKARHKLAAFSPSAHKSAQLIMGYWQEDSAGA